MVYMWSGLFQIPSDEAAKLHVNNHTVRKTNESFIYLGNNHHIPSEWER